MSDFNKIYPDTDYGNSMSLHRLVMEASKREESEWAESVIRHHEKRSEKLEARMKCKDCECNIDGFCVYKGTVNCLPCHRWRGRTINTIGDAIDKVSKLIKSKETSATTKRTMTILYYMLTGRRHISQGLKMVALRTLFLLSDLYISDMNKIQIARLIPESAMAPKDWRPE